ncbi:MULTISPECIES: efflux RND transporter permease subunit [Spirulina sp. CCY15215]|uniref:efflux RND transporter permease subunit n=1 Tax=Spirulina sp. CCY15215 TaxID=2767591 RepID=UPI00195165A4|nr:efflux RND transporter permease subunit [Spirulina major]
MSFHVSSWSIRNPVPTLVMFLILSIVGAMSFFSLGIDSEPNIDFALVQVTVTQQGAGPVEMETQVTKKVEDAVAGLGDIDEVQSTVTDGRSTTVIQFTLGTDSDRATNDVRNAITQIRTDLPQDVNEPIVERLEFVGGSIMTYTVSSDKLSVEELSDFVDRKVARALSSVPGVSQIERLGGVDREIRVNLSDRRLQAYGITATEVNAQIRNFNINLPGGRSEVAGGEQNIRTLGSAETVADLRDYRIVLPNGSTVALSSLGEVVDGFGDPRQAAFLNNQPVVAFSVLRSTGTTLVTVEQGVIKEIEKLKATLSDDIKFTLNFTRGDEIRISYNSTFSALLIGSVLTVLVVGVFLQNLRMTFITALALPLSIIPTFWVMQALNYTLNGMTLLALALAMGNLVDDAICMIENIDQHLLMGKKPIQAATDGAREIGLAVITTTATIVAVFLPVAFMGGIPGQFFQPFGVTVAVATMFSTLVATTMTPMLSAYLLQPKPATSNRTIAPPLDKGGNGNGKLTHLRSLDPYRQEFQEAIAPTPPKRRRIYRSMLTWALRHRITTLLIALAFFIGSLQLVPFIPKGLFAGGDMGLSLVSVELPPGSTLEETTAVLKKTTALLLDNPAVDNVLANASDINSGTAYINLVPKSERIHRFEFEQEMRKIFQQIPGARVSFQAQGGAGNSKDLSILLKSENPTSLATTAEALERQMREIPGFVDVTSSLSLVKPEIVIDPNPDRAADLGVSVQAIAHTASLALIGDTESNLAKFNLSDRQIPIRIQIDSDLRKDIETLKNLRVPSSNGGLVPLSAVATIRWGSGPAEIKRFDRSRQVSLDANLEGLALGDAVDMVRALPAMQLPPDVTEEPVGDAEIMRDIFSRFVGALLLAILSIYAILVLLYNNFLYPLAILAALPLSFGGAFLGLLVTQKELGLFALIGIVLLMGLVTKNAILLVDFTLDAMKQGKPRFKALIESGVSRFRPIVMTSLSTIAGMIPIALEFGGDGEVRSPMAIAVIGGFTTSTLLTLVVIPVIFTYVDNVVQFLLNFFRQDKDSQPPTDLAEETPVEVITRKN